jgi:hypothetical protein
MLIALLALSASLNAQQTAAQDTTKHPVVTPQAMASAFGDNEARELLNRARRTRIAQDSALASYDAKVRQRLSVRASIGRIGPEKLVYRQEGAARVQWDRNSGAHIEMTGTRVAIPIAGVPKAEHDAVQDVADDRDLSPVPYFPGAENIWIGGGTAKADVDEKSLIHPLANGAESWYTYAIGDSASFRLPDGRMVRIRELKIRPRVPKVNVVVGSMWFDVTSGNLVRATYRLAASAKAGVSVQGPDSSRGIGITIAQLVAKALVGPGNAEISAIVVEYGLFQGRFWLPRMQSMEGHVEVMFARVPVTYENVFEYASVNSDLKLPQFAVDTMSRGGIRYPRPPAELDTAAKRRWRDSAMVVYRAAVKARQDSVKAGKSVGSMAQCDSSKTRIITEYRYEKKLAVELRIPCDVDALTHSADFTGSIYDKNEDVFGSADREKAIADALSMSAQAPFDLTLLRLPRTEFGLSMSRFNRVEGFSTGLRLEETLGGGYTIAALGRYGFSDHIPNGEFSIERSNAINTVRLNGYTRLAAANEWSKPLSFGSSLSALLFGRDQGFYYREAGGELLFRTERGVRLDWRLFADHQRSAIQTRGGYMPNIAAWEGDYQGAEARNQLSFGTDPTGFRAFTDLRVEGAHGDSSYGRAALDVTISRNLSQRVVAGITVAGGGSAGKVPPQRRWYLGGAHTIRGQDSDSSQSGNAFWLTRAELARQNDGYKLTLFGDLGWAGDRSQWQKVGRPLSGAGVGISAFDGFIRFDVARGIYPREQTAAYLYLDGRF